VAHYVAYVVAIAASVLGVAFFSGSETAFVSSNRFRIRGMVRRGSRGAVAAAWFLERPNMFVSVAVVGTNVCVVLASSLATYLLAEPLGRYAIVVSTVIMTSVILFLGEIVPKAVGRANPEVFMLIASPALAVFYYVLYAPAWALSAIARVVTRASTATQASTFVTRDEIRTLVKEAAQTGFGLTPNGYIHRALDLSRTKVASAMKPMDDVCCVDAEATVEEALHIASRSGHSRYPVYRRVPEDLVGVLHIKDLLGAPGDAKVKVFARSGYFVPETQTIKHAILEMRDELKHLAVVTDEYGRAIGILTFEDLIEEILGEISDEYDLPREAQVELGATISGSIPVAALNDNLDAGIPEGAYSTVAGFILSRTGSIPKAGDQVRHKDLLFDIVEVKGRRIRTVRITRQEKET
jgi:CBS domain containing-hemolysin-like protein